MNTNKFKVQYTFKDGSTQTIVGVGKPLQTVEEYVVDTPDGVVVAIRKDTVKSYSVGKYEA